MTKKIFIVSLAFVLTACGSMASLIPLDDAYSYPEKKAAAPATADESGTSDSGVSAESGVSGTSAPSTPAMEIISAKDTTITVRIKR